jgi:uncharacterized protein (DUF3084 family)
MRVLPTFIFLCAASTAIPAICQSSSTSNLASPGDPPASIGSAATAKPAPATTPDPVASSQALHQDISQQSKVIQNQIETQRNILKKNQELMKEAHKLDEKSKKLAAKNRKLEEKNQALNAEKKNFEAQDTDLAKKNEALKAAEKPIQTATK